MNMVEDQVRAVAAPAVDATIPACPLCHTVDKTVSDESLRAGATWVCTMCGQIWSADRLRRVANYARYAAAQL
jgi:transposase-like protein